MSEKIFNLKNLVPDTPVFVDDEGNEYPFLSPDETDLITQAVRHNIRAEMDELEKQRRKNPGDIDLAKKWIEKLQDLTHLYIPSLPLEKMRGIRQHQCMEIISWYRQYFFPSVGETTAQQPKSPQENQT